MNTNDTSQYVYKKALKLTYGLSDTWIARIGPPDLEIPNPHAIGKKAYLYRRDRVEAYIDEHLDDYRRLQEQRQRRMKSAQDAAERKYKETLQWANEVEIEVRDLPPRAVLEDEAIRRHIDWIRIRGRLDWAFPVSENFVLAHVRHAYTNYDQLVGQLSGRTGGYAGEHTIRERCNALIRERLGVKDKQVVARVVLGY
jgi:hypothetical protein